MKDSEFVKWLADKPVTFWLTFLGALIIVAARDAEQAPWRARMVKTVSAALLGLGLHEGLADLVGSPPTLTMAAIFIFGQILLDSISALIKDRSELLALIRAIRGQK